MARSVIKAARRVPPPAVCKPFTFRVTGGDVYFDEKGDYNVAFSISAHMDHHYMGTFNVRDRRLNGGRALIVEMAKVVSPRCGAGTQLYQRALELACERGARLASDHSRTAASEGFWKKQVRKKRARCHTHEPGRVLEYDPKKRDFRVLYGQQWPCGQYVMREVCPRKTDLSGRR
jgi:hypothetical protein